MKILVALKESLLFSKSNHSQRLIMTLLVKDEERILEQNILFHKAMGIDAFIITDNNSTDRTPQIIQKYIDKGWVVESYSDHDTRHLQKKKVDRMIWCAKQKHGADWVINCDADEFWFSPKGDLKHEMSTDINVLKCKSINVYPEEGVDFWLWDKVIKPMPDTSKYDLSPYNLFRRYTYKVAHSTKGYVKISMGNHKVAMLPRTKQKSEITIYHYSFMDRESFIHKTAKTRPQLTNKKNKKKIESRHWRHFNKMYKLGSINDEYDKIIGSAYFEEFQKLGYIYQDCRVMNILKEIQKTIK
ncbi:MAG: glycosyltransferase family 2 protein [Rikenellaceae bacterium]